MSNSQVGNIYQQIIADVIESSRVDFEEGGVDEPVLEELRQGWQQKLSQLQVATFPWDPKPDPQPTVNPPTVPSNAGNYQQLPPKGYPMPMPQSTAPRVKIEPGLEQHERPISQAPFQNPILANPNATTAQQRAAQNLQASYGHRAAASISAIQGNAPQQQQQPQSTQQTMQQHQQAFNQQQMAQMQQRAQGQVPRPQITPEQYRQAMAAQTAQAAQAAQAQQRLQTQNNLGNAQTDGAGDDEEGAFGIVTQGGELMGRLEIDDMIRDKIVAMGQTMEGGGLMLPLKQASNTQKRRRKAVQKEGASKAQHDGPGSDDDDKDGVKDDVDEDAINSDLDDPDDGLHDEEDDDEGMGHIMLCMYDKVQRVKNKWKCVMKDGVLTVNGKEYVFHRANGEYEW